VKDQRVSHRYAQALFDTAVENKVVDSVEADLVAIDHLITSDGDFRAFLFSPSRSSEEKAEILEKTLSDRVTALTLRVVRLMLEKRRETELGSLTEAFVALRRKSEGVVYVVVKSAFPLTPDQEISVKTKLAASLGAKIDIHFSIDPSLVGGMTVAYDDFILDGSVTGAFKRLKDSFRTVAPKQS